MNTRDNRPLSRRTFLKKVGLAATAAMTAHLLIRQSHPTLASPTLPEESWGILIDLTRCTGCNSCALACQETNKLPNAGSEPEALDNDIYTFVDTRQVITASGDVGERYIKYQCMHCLNAACVAACPAAAMYKSELGPVVYRPERCLGCRYCQIACPFDIPRFEWENGIAPVISKCWLCYDRLQAGQKPACSEACPTGALRFGRREQLLAQAHAQIASNPGHYVDHIFGEFEAGGTAMLYLSDIPFEELAFPVDLPETAPPEATEKIMATLPGLITGLAALLAGAALYTHRKRTVSIRKSKEEPSLRSSLSVSIDEHEE